MKFNLARKLMTSLDIDFAKTCKEAIGIKGRFLLLGLGIAGLFFPGLVVYSILSAFLERLQELEGQGNG